MSRIQRAVIDYLELRRAMGFKLEREGSLLPQFAAVVDAEGNGHINNQLAVRWATHGFQASAHCGSKRLRMVRLFARYYCSIDPLTEVPSAELVPFKTLRKPPYIYSDEDIAALLAATNSIRSPLLAQTIATLLGLLSVTGMRVGEAIALDRDDVDWETETLVVRKAKFGKSRLVPLHPTTVCALRAYSQKRNRRWPALNTSSFFKIDKCLMFERL